MPLTLHYYFECERECARSNIQARVLSHIENFSLPYIMHFSNNQGLLGVLKTKPGLHIQNVELTPFILSLTKNFQFY